MISFAVEHGERAVLVEVSLERSGSSHVEGHAVEPTTQHFGVAQLYGDDVEPFLLQQLYERRLITIDHDQVRTDAECIHVDPVTPDGFGEIIGIVSLGVFHRRTVDDFPLLQDFRQSIVADASRIAEDQAGAQGDKSRVDMAAVINILEEMNTKLLAQNSL